MPRAKRVTRGERRSRCSRKILARSATPPGPRGHLVLGSLREVQRDPLGMLRDGFRDHGDVVRLRFGTTRALLLAHPEHIGHVLHDNHRNYDKHNVDYAMLRRLLGNGLLTSTARSGIASAG
jgi:hypothetical protein